MKNPVGILEPQSILGKAIGERLVALDPRAKICGYSLDPLLAGELAEFGRGATLIEAIAWSTLSPGDLEVSALFVPMSIGWEEVVSLRRALPAEARLVLADGSGWARPFLVDADQAVRVLPAIQPALGTSALALADAKDTVLLSPAPSVSCQALLAHALRDLLPRHLTTTALEPVSAQSADAVEELLGQTRSILAFTGEMPTEHLGDQQVFNVLPFAANDQAELVSQLTGIEQLSCEERILRAGVFHGLALSVHCVFAEPCSAGSIRAAVKAAPPLRWQDASSKLSHPVSIAGQDGLFVSVASSPGDEPKKSHWFWLLADNLTTVGAWNAVALGDDGSDVDEEVH